MTTVEADDGHRIGYRVSGAEQAPTTVVFLPALGVPLAYYAYLISAWTSAGHQVIGVENRGQPLSPFAGRFGYSDMVRRDLPAVFGIPQVPAAARVVLVGHSIGGALALLATAAGLVAPHAVVTVATGTSWCAAEFGAYRPCSGSTAIR